MIIPSKDLQSLIATRAAFSENYTIFQ